MRPSWSSISRWAAVVLASVQIVGAVDYGMADVAPAKHTCYAAPALQLNIAGDDVAGMMKATQNAYDETIRKVSKNKQPAMMAGLFVGDEVWFASSIKGPRGWALEGAHPAVTAALKQCAEETGPHRTQGACAEVMAVNRWYEDPRNQGQNLADKAASVMTWGVTKDSKEPGPVAPCTKDGASGCREFITKFNLKDCVPVTPRQKMKRASCPLPTALPPGAAPTVKSRRPIPCNKHQRADEKKKTVNVNACDQSCDKNQLVKDGGAGCQDCPKGQVPDAAGKKCVDAKFDDTDKRPGNCTVGQIPDPTPDNPRVKGKDTNAKDRKCVDDPRHKTDAERKQELAETREVFRRKKEEMERKDKEEEERKKKEKEEAEKKKKEEEEEERKKKEEEEERKKEEEEEEKAKKDAEEKRKKECELGGDSSRNRAGRGGLLGGVLGPLLDQKICEEIGPMA